MKKNQNFLTRPAFTLIELLIVVAITGVIITSSVVSYKYLERRKNESKINSDIRQMQLALELYYNKNHTFPGTPGENVTLTDDLKLTSVGFTDSQQKTPIPEETKIYLNKVPESPYIDQPYTYYLHNTSSDSYVISYQINGKTYYVTEKLLNSSTTVDPGGVVLGKLDDEGDKDGGEEGIISDSAGDIGIITACKPGEKGCESLPIETR